MTWTCTVIKSRHAHMCCGDYRESVNKSRITLSQRFVTLQPISYRLLVSPSKSKLFKRGTRCREEKKNACFAARWADLISTANNQAFETTVSRISRYNRSFSDPFQTKNIICWKKLHRIVNYCYWELYMDLSPGPLLFGSSITVQLLWTRKISLLYVLVRACLIGVDYVQLTIVLQPCWWSEPIKTFILVIRISSDTMQYV